MTLKTYARLMMSHAHVADWQRPHDPHILIALDNHDDDDDQGMESSLAGISGIRCKLYLSN